MEGPETLEITPLDLRGVRIYRGGIVVSALAFVLTAALIGLTRGWEAASATAWLADHQAILVTAVLLLIAGTGTSVIMIHLYIRQFHTLLKLLFGIGLVSVTVFAAISFVTPRQFLEILYLTPYGTLGFGFVLAALCGITVKEAFCFGMIEAILFAAVTPVLVLGHLFRWLHPFPAFILLCLDAFFLCIFAARKEIMAADLDVGDKSVYTRN
ncbi:MAG: hypothetical protein GXP58_09635 [Deltaproteobacteria bacterium]|nr:hypothetical protein [Deltaproteobacteria bacterium]